MSSSKTSDLYHAIMLTKKLKYDANQQNALSIFDELHKRILQSQYYWNRWFSSRSNHHLGIYLWGSVGIGKTLLMDCFFDSLPIKKKKRIHFHLFMQEMHGALQQYAGHSDPLMLIAKALHKKVDVLCLDEFFVSDIVDAMILAGLLNALFREGIYFVTTSNTPPQELYKNGLRRDGFLKAITLLQQNLKVIHLDSVVDYRLNYWQSSGIYYVPLNQASENQMKKSFELCAGTDVSREDYPLLGRLLPVVQRSNNAIWCRFDVLCGKMRCKQDYVALTQEFSFLFLSDLPLLTNRLADEVLRFIQLIDILYDTKTKLLISAEVKANELYTNGNFIIEFQRTISRLIEMQSAEYFFS